MTGSYILVGNAPKSNPLAKGLDVWIFDPLRLTFEI
jgi:hypothetical protein